MKRWSRWFLKSEVRRGDTCPEPTELRLLVVWQNQFGPQNPNQICWRRDTNSQTCWRKAYSREMRGIGTPFVQHHEFFDVFLQLFFSPFKNRTPCRSGRTISIQHNGDSTVAEFLIRICISVNQLSVHGAITDWCEELAQQISGHSFSSTVRPVAIMNDESESQTSTAREDVGIMRKILLGHYSMTVHDLDMLDNAENVSLRSDDVERMDSRKHENRPRIGRPGYASLGSISNWNQSCFHEHWWISILDCDQQVYEQKRWQISWRKTENLVTTKRWLPMQGVPLRQNPRNNQLHHYCILKDVCTNWPTEVEWYSCHRLCPQETLFMLSLEDNDSDSSRRWSSNGMDLIVTNVMSRFLERSGMDEYWVTR